MPNTATCCSVSRTTTEACGARDKTSGNAGGRVMKALLACWLTALTLLVWAAMRPVTFEQRWPPALPPAIFLQTYDAARKAVERPSFCAYPSPKYMVG